MLADREIWYNISVTEGLGPVAAQKIWNKLQTMRMGPEVFLEMDATMIVAEFGLSPSVAERLASKLNYPEVEPVVEHPVSLLLPSDEDFPGERFSTAVPPLPPALWLVGERRLLSHKGLTIGVAGSRETSEKVMELAFEISKLASREGFLIVSGLAQGVDSAAHQGAITGGTGTVGVMASGIFRHSGFMPEDLESICLVSQFSSHESWSGPRAMTRNSTIAALSDRVVVCAAGLSGGSWEMAQLCLKKKKPLFVLDLDETEAAGNQALIRAGAQAVSPEQLEKVWLESLHGNKQQTLF